jgi:MOSC domain-containing protein
VVGTVAEVWRYPVKSMAGEKLESAELTDTGFEGDRRWALVDGTVNRAGKLLSIRQEERLMTYRAHLQGDGVEIVTPEGEARRLDDVLVSSIARESGRPLTLRDLAGANFDDSPVLVVNMATVAAFGLEARIHMDHRRFRANLYVEGLEPEEELSWLGRRIAVGGAELDVAKRCDRCVVVTRDPDTTTASPELLRILTNTFEACMGLYCHVARPGRVSVGDLCGPV